jgi:hypothetical protein
MMLLNQHANGSMVVANGTCETLLLLCGGESKANATVKIVSFESKQTTQVGIPKVLVVCLVAIFGPCSDLAILAATTHMP